MRSKGSWKWTLIALIPTFFIVFPIYYVFVGSFETTSQIFHQPPYFFPPTPMFENYTKAFNVLGKYFFNSIIITAGVVFLTLLIAPLASFALAKLKLRFERILNFSFALTQMLPFTSTVIPLYLIFRQLKLINTYYGVILAISSFSISFAVIMLRSYMTSFPIALIEAATIDGAGIFKIYWKIVLPLSVPAITTAAIFAFLQGWNNFVLPLALLPENRLQPLSIGLFNFVGNFGVQWDTLMAGSVVYSIPSIIVIIVGSKFLVSGLTSGAFKE
ncbi:MAG: multiple sugar transport system permease protein [Thermotogaceae bacterium]|jgi:multiple sugar transport system permease protein|nr:multiple sugar transport system permease protein [Thermosipho sp. (in: thermotogales)]MDN5337705.1 multiple sugar transport system permease protein [Thermotogaceae bacterium]